MPSFSSVYFSTSPFASRLNALLLTRFMDSGVSAACSCERTIWRIVPSSLGERCLVVTNLCVTKKIMTEPPETLNLSAPSSAIMSATGTPSTRSTSARLDTNGSNPFQLAARAPAADTSSDSAANRTATLRAFAREKFVFLMGAMLRGEGSKFKGKVQSFKFKVSSSRFKVSRAVKLKGKREPRGECSRLALRTLNFELETLNSDLLLDLRSDAVG